jgi:hypothetical protein
MERADGGANGEVELNHHVLRLRPPCATIAVGIFLP